MCNKGNEIQNGSVDQMFLPQNRSINLNLIGGIKTLAKLSYLLFDDVFSTLKTSIYFKTNNIKMMKIFFAAPNKALRWLMTRTQSVRLGILLSGLLYLNLEGLVSLVVTTTTFVALLEYTQMPQSRVRS